MPAIPTSVVDRMIALWLGLVLWLPATEANAWAQGNQSVPATGFPSASPGGQPTPSSLPPAAPKTTVSTVGGDSVPLTLDAIQARLQQLQASSELDPVVKAAVVRDYESTLAELRSRIENDRLAKELTNAAEAAPQATSEAKIQLAQDSSMLSGASSQIWTRYSTDDLRKELQQIRSRLQTVTDGRTRTEATIATREARRKDLPRLLADDRENLRKLNEELAAQIAPATVADSLQREATRLLVQARRDATLERLRKIEAEQRAYEAEAELLPLRRELLTGEEKRIQASLKLLTDELNKRREILIQSERDKLERLASEAPESLKPVADRMLKRASEWLELARQHSAIQLEIEATKSRKALWTERFRIMKERLEPRATKQVGGFNSLLGLMLRRQRSELPDPYKLSSQLHDYEAKMVQSDLLILELDDWKAQIQASEQAQANALIEAERDLVSKFKVDARQYFDNLFALAEMKRDYVSLVHEYRSFVDQHVLWIRSSDPMNRQELASVWPAIQWLCRAEHWRQSGQVLLQDARTEPWLYLACAAGWTVLVWSVTRLRRFNSILGERASRANVTAFLPTAQTILLCLVLSLPVPILLLFLGWRLQTASQHASFPQAASLGLQVAARYFFSLEFLRQAVRRGGLAESHFQWSTDVCRMLRNNLRWFLDVAVLMVGTVAILSSAADQPWESSLGRMLFVALMLICSCLFLRILRPKSGVLANYLKSHPGGWADRLRFLWYAGFGSAPLALAALSWFGYHYTALRLAMHLHTSVIAMVGMLLLHAMLRRWLWLSRRKILLSQARSRLEVAQKRDPHAPFSGLSHNKEDFDLQEINAQTMRLITSGMVVSVFAALLFIWSGVMPAVSALDAIPLWNVEGATPDKPIPITLAHLLLSIPLLAMTLVAARNLPGLLEIALLQHLPLENAVRYAIATLSRYTIFILGIAITFNTVGVRWSSIQWLVAALGVGLGFGLQEIFANFISGLILLFEQPIRVGDVITLGDTTGSVSRIRMRATTITNWDRQELIIPNKDLITGRLLNWTLSDSTNRVKLQLGIAYGSDTERACQILTQICTSHPNVMKEPLPAAHFESFGDNSLNIVVRLFLANLDLRLQTRHELLTEIHRRFQEAAIEISFPQRDLHIRSLPQSVLQWLSREPSTPIPSAIPATMPRAAGSASSSPLVK